MEKLEFKNYGLRELSSKELRETEGGFFLAGLLVGAIIGFILWHW